MIYETEMSVIVSDHLRALGYRVYAEVFVGYNASIDLVAVHDRVTWPVAIELKRSLTSTLLRQTIYHQIKTPFVWGVIATRPKPAGLEQFAKFGVGIATIASGQVEILLKPQITPKTKQLLRSSRRGGTHDRIHLHMGKENGVGGQPLNAAPAQLIYSRVADYRAKNPEATWYQIFAAIPSHYSHPKSMRSSLKKLAEFKGWPVLA